MLQKVRSDATMTEEGTLSEEDSGDPSAELPTPPPTASLLMAPSSGFLVRIDQPKLLSVAKKARAFIVMDRSPGVWLVAGTPIGVAWPADPAGSFDEQQLAELQRQAGCALQTGHERTPAQDIGYALRQLTDVAIKALSPGINDPTTAVHALAHSSSLLCHLSRSDLGPTTLSDDDDAAVRVVLHRPDLAEHLDLAVSQPRLYGADDAAVLTRLFSLLRELAWTTDQSAHRAAISAQLARLQNTVTRGAFDGHELREFEHLGNCVAAALVGKWPPAGSSNSRA